MTKARVPDEEAVAWGENADLAGRDDPLRRPPDAGQPPVLSVVGFEGPLDWLLALVRDHRLDLARFSILALVEAFAEALERALARDWRQAATLGRWGDWLVMAADLALLRSRLLLPTNLTDGRAAQVAADTLRQQLLRRAEVAAAADWLERQPKLGVTVFAHGRIEGQAGPSRGRHGLPEGDIAGLLRACLLLLRVPDEVSRRYTGPVQSPWTLGQAMDRFRRMLPEVKERGLPLERFGPEIPPGASDRPRHCRGVIASLFGASLELLRLDVIQAEQNEPWQTILVRRGAAAPPSSSNAPAPS